MSRDRRRRRSVVRRHGLECYAPCRAPVAAARVGVVLTFTPSPELRPATPASDTLLGNLPRLEAGQYRTCRKSVNITARALRSARAQKSISRSPRHHRAGYSVRTGGAGGPGGVFNAVRHDLSGPGPPGAR